MHHRRESKRETANIVTKVTLTKEKNDNKYSRLAEFFSGAGLALLSLYVLAQAISITLDGMPRLALGGTAVLFMAIGGVGEFRRRFSMSSRPRLVESDSEKNK